MTLKNLFLGTAACVAVALPALPATSDSLPPCDGCSDAMTIVSWGGAYSASQNNAYHKPYMALTGIKVVNDESSPEAVAKLRAMNEAKNITWDLVDVVAADAIRLCDEGLAEVIDPDRDLAAAPDGTPASKDFGEMLVSECFIPQIVYSTTFGYRTNVTEWGGKVPTDVCALFDTKNFPGKRSLEKRPINNMEWALLCDGVPADKVYDVLATQAGIDRALAKLGTIKADVIWWSAAAEPPQLLADGEHRLRLHLQRPLVLGDRGTKAAGGDALGRAGFRSGWLDCARRSAGGAQEAGHALSAFRHRHPAPGRSSQIHLLRPGPQILGAIGRQARHPWHRDGPPYADRSGKRQEHLPL